MTINIYDLWADEWLRAKNFFDSKGNTKTKSKLKTKWYNGFKEMLFDLEEAVCEDEK